MPYEKAAEYFSKISAVKPDEFYINLRRNAGNAFTISRINDIETLKFIKNEFAKNLSSEKADPAEIKKIVQEAIVSRGDDPLNPWHLETVFRTNTQTAFSKGRLEAQISSGDPYWQYFAVVDGRETELCNYLDGKIFKSSDPFWISYYPPNHFNCRSSVVPVSESDLGSDEVEDDGEKYLKSIDAPASAKKPGKGFDTSPLNSLEKYLNKKAGELGFSPSGPIEPA